MVSDKVDASTIPPPFYGPPLEPPPVPCPGWPHPPRISGYHSMPGPRPQPENSISPVEGGKLSHLFYLLIYLPREQVRSHL